MWMHNGMLQLADEKMSKSVGNIRGLGEVLDEVGGEALVLYFSGGHYRQPIAFSDERLEEAVRSAARIREAGRRLGPGESPEELAPLRDAFFEALADDFNTARALAALYDWIREANRRDGEVGGSHLREMLDVLGLASCSTRAATAPPPRPRSWPSGARRRAAPATGRRPTACATSCAPWVGRFEMARKDRSSSRRGDGGGARPRRQAASVRPQPPRRARAAPRGGGRDARRVAASRAGAAADRGGRGARRRLRPQRGREARAGGGAAHLGHEATAKEGFSSAPGRRGRGESRPAAGPTPTRACARRSTRTRTRTPRSCSRRPTRSSSPSTRSRTRRTSAP